MKPTTIMKYVDDEDNFRLFIKKSRYFLLTTGGTWCFLKKISRKDDTVRFAILSQSDPEDPVPGSTAREVIYSYRDEDYEIDVQGNIRVTIYHKTDEDILGLNFSNSSYRYSKMFEHMAERMAEDIFSDLVLKIKPVDKHKIPLYMTNPRMAFEQELRKL